MAAPLKNDPRGAGRVPKAPRSPTKCTRTVQMDDNPRIQPWSGQKMKRTALGDSLDVSGAADRWHVIGRSCPYLSFLSIYPTSTPRLSAALCFCAGNVALVCNKRLHSAPLPPVPHRSNRIRIQRVKSKESICPFVSCIAANETASAG